MVAPSDMMDGRVGSIRDALDESAFETTAILSYAVKYASAFYGPFRDAADCAPQFGDRSGYQMEPANAREALREARLDEDEGADMLMVNRRSRISMSYAQYGRTRRCRSSRVQCLGGVRDAQGGGGRRDVDYGKAMMEVLVSIRRAGADAILTYHAVEAAEALGG